MMRRRLTRIVCGPCLAILVFCSFDAGGELHDDYTSDPMGVRKLKCVSPDGKDRECAATVCRDWKPMQAALPVDGEARQANHVMRPDPIGAWRLKCVSPDGKDRECIVTVCCDGKAFQGKIQADGETRPAKDVTFEGDVLSFGVDGKFAGQVYHLTYQGKPQGDTLNGTVRWSYGWASGSFAFRGKRALERVASTP
jgi:hypothetical protein